MSGILYCAQARNGWPLFVLISLLLFACDSSNNNAIKQVDSQKKLTDPELIQQQSQKKKQENVFYVGFDLRASPQEDAAQYLPFLKYLDMATGYHFKLHFTSKNSSTVDDLGQNKTQFAAMGAVGFLDAQSRYAAIPLVRGINREGKAEYKSVFVARSKSPIRSIKDIAGRKLGFGSRDSTQGHLIPRIMLTENKITLKDLRSYGYTGSHQKCAEAVIAGKYDVCGMQEQLANRLAGRGMVKIIYSSRFYPSSGIVASQSVPADVINRVRQALLDFDPLGKDSQGLYHWDRTEMPGGFIVASETDYADLRKWAIRFGFLQVQSEQSNKQ